MPAEGPAGPLLRRLAATGLRAAGTAAMATGPDGWCRVKPVAWLPMAFDYKLEPNPAYTGQHGPLAFEDPWWKVVLIILAILLEIASLVYDYVEAGQDPRFIIGNIARNGDAMVNGIDAAVCSLNGSRGTDLGELDAQGDDANNGLPIEGLGNVIALDRTDNGDHAIQDAVLGSVVWKSGGRSGTTRGVVNSINLSTTITYDTEDTISGPVTYTNQVSVNQIAGMEQPVSQAGDSGSVWVDMATKRAIALNFAGAAVRRRHERRRQPHPRGRRPPQHPLQRLSHDGRRLLRQARQGHRRRHRARDGAAGRARRRRRRRRARAQGRQAHG